MVAAISVLFVLAMAYAQYKQAERNGQWSWAGFFTVFGAMGAFVACFIIPAVNSTFLQAHPGWMMTLILSGILIFVSALILACRRYYGRFFPVKDSSASPSETAKNSKSVIPIVAIACVVASTAHAQAQPKSVYKDPAGAFSVTVPAGWQTQPQPGSPMISIANAKSKVSVTLGVMRGPAANTPSAQKELAGIQAQFPQSCPKAKIEGQGPTKLAGLGGVYLVVHCSPPEGGAQLMKFTAATKPGTVALMITSSPGSAYLKELVPLMEISGSLRILAPAGPDAGSPTAGQAARRMPPGQTSQN